MVPWKEFFTPKRTSPKWMSGRNWMDAEAGKVELQDGEDWPRRFDDEVDVPDFQMERSKTNEKKPHHLGIKLRSYTVE